MAKANRRTVFGDFTDNSWGVNLTEDGTQLDERECSDSLNAILRKNGLQRRPGAAALSSFNLAKPVTGLIR